jgi:hypothetical protein
LILNPKTVLGSKKKMSKGFIKVLRDDEGKEHFIKKDLILSIDSYIDLSTYKSMYYKHLFWKYSFKCMGKEDLNCTCKMIELYTEDPSNIPQNLECNCVLTTLPMYIIYVKKENKPYIVHPDEKEHMERFISGTDDPLYDLVHELRYNPNLRLGMDCESLNKKYKSKV